MPNISQINIPVKNQSTGEIEPTLFDIKSEDVSDVNEVISTNGAKNLFKSTISSQYVGNTEVVVHEDGTIDINTHGTLASDLDLEISDTSSISLSPGTYKISGCPYIEEYHGNLILKYIYGTTAADVRACSDTSNGNIFTLTGEETKGWVRIHIDAGCNVNTTFKPMITLAVQDDSDYLHYVPYARTNKQLTDDVEELQANRMKGAVDILSYSENNKFQIPADGYIRYGCKGNVSGYVIVVGSDEITSNSAYIMAGNVQPINSTTVTVLNGTVFVKKGMYAYCAGSLNVANYIELY